MYSIGKRPESATDSGQQSASRPATESRPGTPAYLQDQAVPTNSAEEALIFKAPANFSNEMGTRRFQVFGQPASRVRVFIHGGPRKRDFFVSLHEGFDNTGRKVGDSRLVNRNEVDLSLQDWPATPGCYVLWLQALNDGSSSTVNTEISVFSSPPGEEGCKN